MVSGDSHGCGLGAGEGPERKQRVHGCQAGLAMDFLPHLLTLVAAVITTLGTIKVTNIRVSKHAQIELKKSEITDQEVFRSQLMEQLAAVTDRLNECQRQCENCHREHEQARQEKIMLQHKVTRLESRIRVLEEEQAGGSI